MGCNYSFMPNFTKPQLNRRQDEYYIPLFYVDIITYPCPNTDSGLQILLVKEAPGQITNVLNLVEWFLLYRKYLGSHSTVRVC